MIFHYPFSVVLGGLGGIFPVGVVDPSGFGWGLVPGSSFRLSLP